MVLSILYAFFKKCVHVLAVHKFRRRPQYLEFFVHLASTTVAKGLPERVLEWGQEAFSWLARSDAGTVLTFAFFIWSLKLEGSNGIKVTLYYVRRVSK